jgi:hypothetical protein
MAFFGDIVKGGLEGLLSGAGSFAKDVRAAITGKTIIDATAQAELEMKAVAFEAAAAQARLDYDRLMAQGQMAINQAEAVNPSLFVSGWRPMTGWVCNLGLAYTFLIKPLLPFTVSVIASIFGYKATLPVLPDIPMADLFILLGGMLGLAVTRSVDKYNKVASR